MAESKPNWFKLFSGVLTLIYLSSLFLLYVSCAGLDGDEIGPVISCTLYSLAALGAFLLSAFSAVLGLYANEGTTGREARYFYIVLLINFAALATAIYFMIRS